MRIRKTSKIVAFSLAIVFILQLMPLSTIATQLSTPTVVNENNLIEDIDLSSGIVSEVESLRDEYTKHFRCEDGSFIAATYNEPIHYRVNNRWEEIDNTLVSDSEGVSVESVAYKNAKYSITKTSTPITFPENINNGKITIKNGNNTVSFGAKSNSANAESVANISTPENLTSNEVLKSETKIKSQTEIEKDKSLISNVKASALAYPNAFDNAYLEYQASSSMLKESIVVTEKSDNYKYEFSIDFGSFCPVVDKNGGINIYKTEQPENPVMAIAPPYMFDADNESSDAVTMKLVENVADYTLVIEASAEWINDKDRVFPIVIDPTFILNVNFDEISDVHVNQNTPNSNFWNRLDYQLEVGRKNNNVYRTYIKYNLPALPDCSVVTNAELQLIQNWLRNIDSTDIYLNVYRCDTDWQKDSITWNNQPVQNLSQATIIDYTNFQNGMSAEYNLNITKIVKDWYENGKNYGLMLASSDETVEEKTSFYSSRNVAELFADVKPVVTVSYVNNNGMEDYWSYEGFSLGISGSAYVNAYNGALTYIHGDVSTNGLVLPVSISHVYRTDEINASGEFGNMKFGKGFSLSALEKIESVNSDLLSAYPYKYIDADGTVHFFKQDSTGCYYEFDTDTRLNVSSSGYVMSFYDGSRKEFNTSGFLTKTVDNNGNAATLTYSSGRLIRVTDGGGVSVTLAYNSDNTLKHIADAAGRKTLYAYTAGGYLSSITYPDRRSTSFAYNTDGLLEEITAFDGKKATLDYKEIECPGNVFYRVVSYSTYGDFGVLYETVDFVYQTCDTVIRNSKGDKLVVAFDNLGRAIGKTLNDEKITALSYNNSVEGNGNYQNTLAFSSNTFDVKNGVLSYSYPARIGSGWTVKYDKPNSVTIRSMNTERLNYGIYSKKITRSQVGYAYLQRRFAAYEAATFTVSVYVNILDTLSEGEVYLRLTARDENKTELSVSKSNSITTTNNEWQLLSATITTAENTADILIDCGMFDAVGTVYVDVAWIEYGEIANPLNLVQNNSFNYSLDSWFEGGRYSGFITLSTNPIDGSGALKIQGKPNEQVYAFNQSEVRGKAGDVFVFGASAQAMCSSSGNTGQRFFGIKVLFYENFDVLQTVQVPFNEDAYDTMQTVISSVTAAFDYNGVEIRLCYDNEINTAIFDDVFLYREGYATHYDYDSKGRVLTVRDDNGNSVGYNYSLNGDVIGATAFHDGLVNQSVSYAYDVKHNLLSSAGADGVVTTYNYPASGNKGLPLSVTVSDTAGQNSATTSYTYYNNYNYLKSVTDPSGATVQYEYDNGGNITKGLVTKVTDPNGNETVYEYDPDNDMLLSVSNPSAAVGSPETLFYYDEADRLSMIETDDLLFYMNYDVFDRLELAETSNCGYFLLNEYDEDGNVSAQNYGYYDWGDFTYDDDGRLLSESYNAELAYEYSYADNGQLSRVADHENDVVWNYGYDLAGRLRNVYSDDDRSFNYSYNEKNQLGGFKFLQGGSAMVESCYTYDSAGRAVGMSTPTMTGEPTQEYSYDTLGRTSSVTNEYAENGEITQSFTYKVNGTNQTGRVNGITYRNGSEMILPALGYGYDANGNITEIYKNGILWIQYYYDELNRLVREDNGDIGKSIVYAYGKTGNILSKTEYSLSFDELGTPVDTIAYAYGFGASPHAVKNYDGEAIHYNERGNPIEYRDFTMTWARGQQLATVAGEELYMTFKYDSNGLRTVKTVNGVATEFTYIGDMLVSQKTGNEIINFAYTAGGAPYGFTYNGASYYYLLNLQGDVIAIYDSTGTVVVEYLYDSWGKLESITGSLASTIGIKNPLRYRGYYYDIETRLYYLQSRYYDPGTGRFISMDAYFVAGDYLQGINMYSYCLNNPIMYVDPTGYITTGEVIYMSVGIVAGLIYLSENMPILDVDIFIRSLKSEVDLLSGIEIADIILSLCLLVSEGALEGANRSEYFVMAKKVANKKGADGWVNRNDKRHGSENRQKTGARERNVGHKNGEEHSVKPKGNGVHIPKAVETGIVVGGTIITGAIVVVKAIGFFGRTMAFGLA